MTSSRPAVRIEETLLVPSDVGDLESFRRWSVSSSFPEQGRIDFLEGTVEVDMSPEDLQTHGKPKGTLFAYLERLVSENDLGEVYVDRTRLRSNKAGLSCEPDVVFVSWETLKSKVAQHVPSTTDPDRFVEIEGAVDLVIEVVSTSSVEKDTRRLPPLYAKAGIKEYWKVDARDTELLFEIFHLEGSKWTQASKDTDGFQISCVLERKLKFRREPGALQSTWRYFVDELLEQL